MVSDISAIAAVVGPQVLHRGGACGQLFAGGGACGQLSAVLVAVVFFSGPRECKVSPAHGRTLSPLTARGGQGVLGLNSPLGLEIWPLVRIIFGKASKSASPADLR